LRDFRPTEDQGGEPAESVLRQACRNRDMNRHHSFFGHLHAIVKSAPFYAHWKNLLAYLRRIRTVALILRIGGVVLTVLETGALVLLSTALFVVILPVLGALMSGILLTALLESRRSNRVLSSRLRKKDVIVLFWDLRSEGFQLQNARDLAKRGKAVLLVSPYWISAKGLHHAHFYTTFREEGQNLYLIRRYYYFSLRKHVLTHENATYVY